MEEWKIGCNVFWFCCLIWSCMLYTLRSHCMSLLHFDVMAWMKNNPVASFASIQKHEMLCCAWWLWYALICFDQLATICLHLRHHTTVTYFPFGGLGSSTAQTAFFDELKLSWHFWTSNPFWWLSELSEKDKKSTKIKRKSSDRAASWGEALALYPLTPWLHHVLHLCRAMAIPSVRSAVLVGPHHYGKRQEVVLCFCFVWCNGSLFVFCFCFVRFLLFSFCC